MKIRWFRYFFVVFLCLIFFSQQLSFCSDVTLTPKIKTIIGNTTSSALTPGDDQCAKMYVADNDKKTSGSWNTSVTQSGTVRSVQTYFVQYIINDNNFHFKNWVLDPTSVEMGGITYKTSTSTYDEYPTALKVKVHCGVAFSCNYYTITAIFEKNFYASMTGSISGASTTKSVTVSCNTSQYGVESASTNYSYNLTAPNLEEDGYYFVGWEGTGISFASSTSLSTTATVAPSSTPGGTASYTATAKYKPYYHGKLTVSQTTGASGTVSGGGTCKVATTSTSYTFNNLTASAPSNGYHFTGWTYSGNSISFSNASSLTTNATITNISSTNKNSPTTYTAVANYAKNYYASITGEVSGNGSSTTKPTVVNNTGNYGVTTSGGSVSFTLTAPTAASGYHFDHWEGTAFGSNKPTSNPVSVNVAASTTSGGTATYTAKAVFVQNVYYAKLSATQSSNGTISITQSTKSTTSKSGNVSFDIVATPATGYHLVSWSKTGSVGSFGSETSATTTFTAPAASNYDESNAVNYTITATFAQDQFYAKVIANVSTYGGFESPGTAKVSLHNAGTYASEAIGTANKAQTMLSFDLLGEPNKGYQLKGWSKTNGNNTLIDFTLTTAYRVKASATEGQTETYNVYAVYDKGTYTVTFDGNGAASGSMNSQQFTSFTKQNLTANAFVNNFVVTYDALGGSCSTASETKGRFKHWSVDGESTTYADKAEITRTEVHGATVKLKAVWNSSLSFTLPTPTKTEYGKNITFLGWYDAATGGNKVGDAGATVSISASKTLYARWQECVLVIATVKGDNTTEVNNDRIIFNVAHNTVDNLKYRISIPIGESRTIKGIVPGTYSVTPEIPWSWNYTVSDAQSAEFTTTSTAAQQSKTVTFTVTSKNSTKKHDEVSNQKSF